MVLLIMVIGMVCSFICDGNDGHGRSHSGGGGGGTCVYVCVQLFHFVALELLVFYFCYSLFNFFSLFSFSCFETVPCILLKHLLFLCEAKPRHDIYIYAKTVMVVMVRTMRIS